MNVKLLVLRTVLGVVAVVLAIYLYIIIQEPIEFEKAKKVRYDAAVERLKEIREAQLGYKELNGKFAASFDALLYSIKNDTFPAIKIIGNPDAEDSTAIVLYDTTLVPMMVKVFPRGGVAVDSLPYVPFSGGKKFNIDAGEIEKNKVTIQVFEVSTPEPVLLDGLNEKYIDYKHVIKVGSMYEGTFSGNWE